MPSRTRATLAFSLASLLLIPLSAGTAAASDEGPSAAERVQSWRGVDREGVRGELARFFAGEVALGEAVARAGARSLLDAMGLDGVAIDPDCEFVDHFLLPGGDLDADGKADALDVELTGDFCEDEFHTSLSAVDGQTGAEMWAKDDDSLAALIPAGNLDGQPGDDVLLVSILSTATAAAYRDTSAFAVVRGTNGTQVWSRTYENPWTVAEAGNSFAYVDVNFVLPHDLTDANGDGRTDLIVRRDHITAASPDGEIYEGGAATVFETLSGTDGLTLSAIPGAARQGFPDAAVVPDLSGDGNRDLAVLSFYLQPDGTGYDGSVIAYSGLGGAPRWRAPFQGEQYPPYVHGFDRGPGTQGDVLLEFSKDEATELVALSGATGAERWRKSVATWSFWVESTSDVDGDGGRDLLLAGMPPYDTDQPGVSAAVLGGGNGAVVWSSAAHYAEPVGDATGDGILDALVTTFEDDDETTELVSGADGSTVWSASAGGDDDGYEFVVAAGGDLDGDGADDALRIRFGDDGDAIAGLSGRNGNRLWWSREVGGYLFYAAAAGVFEGPGEDLLEWVLDLDTFSLGGSARRGETGDVLWSR